MSIKEIARRTGASQATVSRVLNNPEHRCSDPKLRDKIWKVVMELHYVPNEAARDLKNKKQGDKKQTYYIQVLVTRSDIGQTDPFIEELAVLLLLDRIEGRHQSEVVMELKGKLLIRESVRKYGDNDWSDYVI